MATDVDVPHEPSASSFRGVAVSHSLPLLCHLNKSIGTDHGCFSCFFLNNSPAFLAEYLENFSLYKVVVLSLLMGR